MKQFLKIIPLVILLCQCKSGTGINQDVRCYANESDQLEYCLSDFRDETYHIIQVTDLNSKTVKWKRKIKIESVEWVGNDTLKVVQRPEMIEEGSSDHTIFLNASTGKTINEKKGKNQN